MAVFLEVFFLSKHSIRFRITFSYFANSNYIFFRSLVNWEIFRNRNFFSNFFFKQSNFASLLLIWKNWEVQFEQHSKIPIFDSLKCNIRSPTFKNSNFEFRRNWEKIIPDLSCTVEIKKGNLYKIRLVTFQT